MLVKADLRLGFSILILIICCLFFRGDFNLPVGMRYSTRPVAVTCFEWTSIGLSVSCQAFSFGGTGVYDRLCFIINIARFVTADATTKGNVARFTNHSCEPSVNATVIYKDKHKSQKVCALSVVVLLLSQSSCADKTILTSCYERVWVQLGHCILRFA